MIDFDFNQLSKPCQILTRINALEKTIYEIQKSYINADIILSGTDLIKEKLRIILELDQITRVLCVEISLEPSFSAGRKKQLTAMVLEKEPSINKIDEQNLQHVKEILNTIGGWPIKSIYGSDAGTAVWAVVQHNNFDHEFQIETLYNLEKCVINNEADPKEFALLFDRVQINSGAPQRYGTQGEPDNDNIWHPFECEQNSVENIESLISELGIKRNGNVPWTLKEYYIHMNQEAPLDKLPEIKFLPVLKSKYYKYICENSPHHP